MTSIYNLFREPPATPKMPETETPLSTKITPVSLNNIPVLSPLGMPRIEPKITTTWTEDIATKKIEEIKQFATETILNTEKQILKQIIEPMIEKSTPTLPPPQQQQQQEIFTREIKSEPKIVEVKT